MKRYLLLNLFVVVIFTSCITNKDHAYLQDIKHVNYEKSEFEDYKLKPNDDISIRVFSSDQEVSNVFMSESQSIQSNSYRIYPDGHVDIPFVQNIYVAGKTLGEANKIIEEKLNEYIPNSFLKVALSNPTYYIIGEGNAKGEYFHYKDKLNIFEALAQSGDLNISSNKRKIKVLREIDGKTVIHEFDLRSKSVIDSKFYYIYPNDLIYVERSRGSFYQINSFPSFLGLVSSSLTFLLLVVSNSN